MRFVPTGSPRLRSSRANPTSIEAAESSETSDVVVAEHVLQMRDNDLLVLVVLYNRAQRLQSRLAFELVGTEAGQCVRPVDGLGDSRRLCDLERPEALDRRGDLARQRFTHPRSCLLYTSPSPRD